MQRGKVWEVVVGDTEWTVNWRDGDPPFIQSVMENGEGFKKQENVPAKKGPTLFLYDGKIRNVSWKKSQQKQYFGKSTLSINVDLQFIYFGNLCKYLCNL